VSDRYSLVSHRICISSILQDPYCRHKTPSDIIRYHTTSRQRVLRTTEFIRVYTIGLLVCKGRLLHPILDPSSQRSTYHLSLSSCLSTICHRPISLTLHSLHSTPVTSLLSLVVLPITQVLGTTLATCSPSLWAIVVYPVLGVTRLPRTGRLGIKV
jgi:hypothetical protein